MSSWAEMYASVLRLLHAEDKTVLAKLAHQSVEENELALHVSNNSAEFNKSVEIDTGIYVWTNMNTQYRINTLRRFFVVYNADPEDLVFYMKDDSGETESDSAYRYELRRKYWAYALPQIQQAHDDTGCFSGATGSKNNWVAGAYGVSGCNIGCIANYDSARIEFYLKRDNIKDLFDYLYAHKEEIESKAGTAIEWDRGDDKKSCRLYYEVKNMSINNEDDWPKMAAFHAEWSKKLYDAVVPHIQKFYS